MSNEALVSCSHVDSDSQVSIELLAAVVLQVGLEPAQLAHTLVDLYTSAQASPPRQPWLVPGGLVCMPVSASQQWQLAVSICLICGAAGSWHLKQGHSRPCRDIATNMRVFE